MKRIMLISYAMGAYAIGLSSLLYMIGFLVNAYVPKGIDGANTSGVWLPLIGNFALICGYFSLHSLMARPRFKRWWVNVIPRSIERSTYVLVSGLTFYLLVILWQPLDVSIWSVQNEYARGIILLVYLSSWLAMTFATFNIDHLSFFGLRQAWFCSHKKVSLSPGFSAKYLYRLTRHPISTCWFVVMWATPDMTLGHLLLAVSATFYILIITPVEEEDLVAEIGAPYEQYRKEVRRYIPLPK